MWKSIVDLLTDRGSLGTGIPICCHVHREDGPTYVNLPGQIQRCAPDGERQIGNLIVYTDS